MNNPMRMADVRPSSGLPRRYMLSVGLQIAAVLAGICAITCGIYMIERTVGILEIALRHNFPVRSFIGLVLLQLPTLAEFALPFACYAAAHFILVARRERREFVTLAAAGVSTGALVTPVVAAAFASSLVSLAFTDTVAPAATRAYRQIETTARAQVLSSRLPESRFFVGEGAVLYVGKGTGNGSTLRLFQRRGGEIASILASDCASPQTSGSQIRLRLCGGDAYMFNRPLETGVAPTHVNVAETIYPFDAATVLGSRAGARIPTLSIRDLLGNQGSGVPERAEGISRLLAALACLLAASLAVLSVAWTSIRTGVFTFLGGSLAMLAVMGLRDHIGQILAGIEPIALAGIGIAGAIAAVLLPGLIASRLDARLVAPAMVKT